MAEAEDDLGRPLRGVVEVEWDGWDEEPRRSRAVWVGAVLLVALAVVAGLVWWAAGTDAELPPASTTTTEVAPAG